MKSVEVVVRNDILQKQNPKIGEPIFGFQI